MNWEALVAGLRKILTPAQVCWLCLGTTGGLYTYAIQTFASTSEVKTLHIAYLESSAFEIRAKQCDALKRGQPGAAYREKLQDLLRKYYELTGTAYQLPSCDEL